MKRQQRLNRGLCAMALAIPTVVGLVPPAMAEVTQIRQPISFTLSGCTALPPGMTVHGSGESFVVMNTRIDSKTGVTYVEQNSLATGTATDSNGASYMFNYHQHLSTQIPSGGFPMTANLTDHFNLVGNGQANQMQVHVVARVTISSPTSFTFDIINLHGDPGTCDPI
jgi:hypothetical protein